MLHRGGGFGLSGPYPYDPRKQAPKDPRDSEVEVLPTVDDALRLEKTEQWRFDRLRAAGYTESQSLMLAIQRDVDLHKAVDLAHKAGPQLAYQIVS